MGKSRKQLGQYIYYSTLVGLQTCNSCGLVFADKRIDPSVVQAHFERAYKEETYFLKQRGRIFAQIAKSVEGIAPNGGRILDIGGAKGHLLAELRKRRPDLTLVVNDLSAEACAYAASVYGFQTVCGGVESLEKMALRFDVVIMSDVAYYEPEIHRLWALLSTLVSDDGTVIIRVPNKLALIRAWQYLARAITRPEAIEMQTRVKFFNPEHLYVFSKRYLSSRLERAGFLPVTLAPSEPLVRSRADFFGATLYWCCSLLFVLSFRRLVISPSFVTIAKRRTKVA